MLNVLSKYHSNAITLNYKSDSKKNRSYIILKSNIPYFYLYPYIQNKESSRSVSSG